MSSLHFWDTEEIMFTLIIHITIRKPGFIVQKRKYFNVLWKGNWTREAEKVLKAFEKDVIMKVMIH